MHIAIPREIKSNEGRVALIPAACRDLVSQGHEVYVQSGAGAACGYSDPDYQDAGAVIVSDAKDTWARGELILKVKEPQASEYPYLNANQILFCFLHLVTLPELTQVLKDAGITAIGFETVQTHDGALPILTPMSEIAGRLAVQIGTTLLHAPNGGKGILLGGLPGADRGSVVIIGAGNAGAHAAQVAATLGARVTVFDLRQDRLERLHNLAPNITTHYPWSAKIEQAVASADLLVGAVLVAGRRAPQVISEAQVKSMQVGSVIVDISIDQGGCVATSRPVSYANPTYNRHGIVHFSVTNMPGGVPRTASQCLSAALTPYVMRLAAKDWQADLALSAAVNISAGRIQHPALKEEYK
ncbi:MAG: alanine dehydrogenase [Gammaproteobacteria bacterium]|nr:MAG: alanine dehydrogenase [Gammaproteobacteria bacterium]